VVPVAPSLHAADAGPNAAPAFLQGGGDMGERMRAFDWASHPLGPPAQWPAALQMAVSLCLNASFPAAIYWDAELFVLYNDAWSEIPAERHPQALGQQARELWSDIWPVVGPQFEQVMATGEGLALYEQMLPMQRGGKATETWWNYSITALRHPDNSIGGVYNQGHEVTGTVLARRARQAEIERLRDLFEQAPAPVALMRGPDHVFEIANPAYRRLVAGRKLLGLPVAQALPEVVDQGFVALLDQVYRSGQAHVGKATRVMLQRTPEGEHEESVLDFVYQPVRDSSGQVDGVFVLVTDVTDRARAEKALRISNWQLGEERARLAALVEAEQRAQAALRRFNDVLEATVKARTAALTEALEQQRATAERLRASFETPLMYQGFLDTQGILLDTNPTSLQGIRAQLADVVGRTFWSTPWFTATPGMPDRMERLVRRAAQGETVRERIGLQLPDGLRQFDFTLRPVPGRDGALVGIVPEAVDLGGLG
jgi:PAS domain-containing protein